MAHSKDLSHHPLLLDVLWQSKDDRGLDIFECEKTEMNILTRKTKTVSGYSELLTFDIELLQLIYM